jgi:Chagasin family peptidase inhibitor I42
MAEVPERLVVNVGETRTVRLAGYAGGGYRWSACIEPAAGVAQVSVVGSEEPVRGTASNDELLRVRGAAPGEALVEVVLQRSWEPNPVEKHAMHITVTAGAGHQQVDEDARSVR